MKNFIMGLLAVVAYLFFYAMVIYVGLRVILAFNLIAIIRYVLATLYVLGAIITALLQLNTSKGDKKND